MCLTNTLLLSYILVINTISACFFGYDKFAAIKSKTRIPERFLHFLELVGGVFSILILMYIIRHKNRKFKYASLSWLIVAAWFTLIYFVIKYHII